MSSWIIGILPTHLTNCLLHPVNGVIHEVIHGLPMLPQEGTSDGAEVYEVSYIRRQYEALQSATLVAPRQSR